MLIIDMRVEKLRTTTKIDILDERAACNKQPVISNLLCLWLAIKEKFAEFHKLLPIKEKVITPEVFKPQGLLLLRTQIYSSQCAGFVFASLGDPPEIRTPDPLLKRQLLCQLS